MIPEADIVALSTSVSNHWSRKSMALMVISWTWLYLSSLERPWNRRAEEEQLHQFVRIERRGIGRHHAEDRFHEAAHGLHRLAELFVGFRIELGMPRDLAARLAVIVHPPQVVAAGHGRESAVERKNLQAVARKIEVANDLRPQQRDHVRAHRELESGKDFFGDGCAAEHMAALQHQNFLPGLRQVGGVDQAVVAAADDDHVVLDLPFDTASFSPRLYRLAAGKNSVEK